MTAARAPGAAAAAPAMAVRTCGRGPDVVLFHGGMGSWRHWARNLDALAGRYTVHALDHPSYGASAPVPRETTGAEYLDLVERLFRELFPGTVPLRLAGFSFGGAIATRLAARLGERVSHLGLVSPAGFAPRAAVERPTRSYREAGDDEAAFRAICRHNLLVNMLADPASADEEAVDVQAYGVRHARFNSRKVSLGGTLLADLAAVRGRARVLWGEHDDAPFRPADLLLRELRAARPGLDVRRVPGAGHWAAWENAPAVNQLLLEFFASE